MKRGLLAALSLLCISVLGSASAGGAPLRPSKVFVIVFENTDVEEAMKGGFFRRLADGGAFLASSYALTHPSYPNYLALTSGTTWGVDSGRQVTIPQTHLGDLLEAGGRSWKVYAQGYPGNCFLGEASGAYVRRHVPFLSYENVQKNRGRCARVVNSDELRADVAAGRLADFSLYVPDNDHNGHDTDVRYAERWFEKEFSPLLADRRFTDGLLFVVTFDEGTDFGPNHIYTAFWGEAVRAGAVSRTRYDHYDLLRTIEDLFGLGTLGRYDARASRITGIWRQSRTRR